METKQRFITMFIALVAMFMGTLRVNAISPNDGAVIAKKDFTGGFEGNYPNWYQFGAGQDGSISSDPDGVAINVGSKTGQFWDPQVMLINEEIQLRKGGNYKVVVTAKFPCNGQLLINMGSWAAGKQYPVDVVSTGEFQEVEINFLNYPYDCNNSGGVGDAHVLFMCGDFLGTTIVKKIQVWDLDAGPYAVLSDDGKTLTFYCDGNKSSYEDKAYDLNEGYDEPGWISDNRYIEKVVFDESFKDARPTSTFCWFSGNRDLDTFVGWGNLNTSEVTNMSQMFQNCSGLTSVILSGFDTQNVTNMSQMFFGCSSLTSINLSGINTSNVEFMNFMFSGCQGLTSLDLSSFNTTNVRYMNSMFNACDKLKTIIVGVNWTTDNVPVASSSNMFSNCTSLVGGAGTTYNSDKVDKEYARIDGGTSNPGYLTSLTYNLKLAGVRVTAANQNNVLDNGIFTYVPSSKTLKVKGSFSSSLNAPLIESSIDGLIIDVMQDAVLEASSTNGNQVFWLKDGTTTMKGMGKLTLKSLYETGIYLTNSASVVIDNMNMVIDAYWGIAGPPSGQKQEKLTIKSSNIVITTGSSTSNDLAAICDLRGGIVLQGCSITSPNGYNISNGSVYNNGNWAREVTITSKGGISTDIDQVTSNKYQVTSDDWYTIDGRKLNGKPAKKGVYIHNGKKAVVH